MAVLVAPPALRPGEKLAYDMLEVTINEDR